MGGDRRPSFFDYLHFNLPRLTKVVLIGVIAGLGMSLGFGAALHANPFPLSSVAIFTIVAGCCVFVVLALFTTIRPWGFGLALSMGSALVYILGSFLTGPSIASGDSTGQVALWNLTILVPAVYVGLFWALRRGILIAHPDQRQWHD